MSVKCTFGLTDKNTEVIESVINEFGSSKHAWQKIGKEIGWVGEEAAYWYIKDLRKRIKELEQQIIKS